MADKKEIGLSEAHYYLEDKDKKGECRYCDGTQAEHKELFPERNPKARIEYAKPHRFVRRIGSRGNCDYCGETHAEHKKYFGEWNPEKDDKGLEIEPGAVADFSAAFQKVEA